MQRLLTFIVLSIYLNSMAHADTATIAVASNFRGAMTELMAGFHSQYPQHQLKQSNASSGAVFNQIAHGAPFDVFLSADSRYPTTLETQGLGIAGTRITYAEGRLAFASSEQAISDSKMMAEAINVAIRQQQKIAIANPDIAPYGIAAKQALTYIKLWDIAEPQLVKGSNVGQAFQFIATGNAPAGIAAMSQVRNINPNIYYWPIPQLWHQPIRQQAILLQSGQNNQAAITFMRFLQSEPAKLIIRQHGYSI